MDQGMGAKCLDGSAPSIYIKNPEKYKTDPTKFIFYFKGGGWCRGDTLDTTQDNCVGRSQGDNGSSKKLKEYKRFDGILSERQKDNEYFYDYTVVYLNYCDGTGHQGYLQNPVHYDGEEIWFRGKQNTLTILKYAKEQLGMAQAEQVIVTGTSAGGLATYTWIDYIADDLKQVNPKIKVYGVADAGLFMDGRNVETNTHLYAQQMKNMFILSNSESNPINTSCLQEHPSERWKCMFAQYLIPHIKSPLLIVNSAYDGWAIQNIVGTHCAGDSIHEGSLQDCNEEEMKGINEYRDAQLELILDQMSQNPSLGAWYISCVAHDLEVNDKYESENWNIPEDSGYTVQQAIHNFVQEIEPVLQVEIDQWPTNQPCADIQQIKKPISKKIIEELKKQLDKKNP